MKIIGGHDYYDSALGYGRDEDIVFVRDHKIISTEASPLWSHYPHNISCKIKDSHWGYSDRNEVVDKKHGRIRLTSVCVYVAGVRYGGVAAITDGDRVVETFWKQETLEEWLSGYNCRIFKPKKETYKWQNDRDDREEFPDIESWFTSSPAIDKQLTWLIENRVVTAICARKVSGYYYTKIPQDWHINCADKDWALKDWGFAKAVDPYTLFQELSMFVGGVLPRNPHPMVEITDPDIKAAKHGFDKWSFRKHKDDPKVESTK